MHVRYFHFVFIVFFLFSVVGSAKVAVKFHPHDPTLKTIAKYVEAAEESVDIAMYNIDVSDKSPLIQTIKKMEKKIKDGDIEFRLIFEGYGTLEENTERSEALEELGIDVRWLASGKKVHHKFAVIDGMTDDPKLITGSANWSLSSRNNYNENILYMDNEPEMAGAFLEEFALLWGASNEFGEELSEELGQVPSYSLETGLGVFFNTDNFVFKGKKVTKKRGEDIYRITREIVKAIERAKDRIEIATTRIKLRPIYDALVKAAKPPRNVKIDIIVNLDQYAYESMRKKFVLKECPDAYDKSCSSGVNFSHFLSLDDFKGHENVNLRVKIFSLSPAAYMSKQMHSKYIMVDDRYLWTGSFNWSYSAEYNHIENLVYIDGKKHKTVFKDFQEDFDELIVLGRDGYKPLINRLEKALKTGTKTDCRVPSMALSFAEIDYLLGTGRRFGKSLRSACK